jgi:hypothetical protein
MRDHVAFVMVFQAMQSFSIVVVNLLPSNFACDYFIIIIMTAVYIILRNMERIQVTSKDWIKLIFNVLLPAAKKKIIIICIS